MAEKRQFLRIAKILSTAFCFAVALFAAPAFADVVSCKNLFDSTKVSVGYVNSDNGTVGGAETYSASDFIPVVAGQKYYLGGNRFSGTNTGAFYKSDKTYLSGITANGIINVPQDAAYIRFTILTTALGTVQFERGSTATSYVPYNPLCATCQGIIKTYESAVGTVAQNGTPTPTNPVEPTFYQQGDMVLRKVGDVADSYDATTGKITRRVGVRTFNGTEFWRDDGGWYHMGLKIPTPMIITHGTFGSKGSGTVFASSGAGFIEVWGNAVGVTDATGFKQWLVGQYAAGTPLTVYYALPSTDYTEETVGTTYCAPAIKIATTAYNAAAFAPVEAALESAVTTIKDVVANTIVQADAIQNLQDTKQTMPDASGTNGTCPKFRQCLLIETDDGTPQWFQIADPVHDLVSSLKNNKVNNSGQTTNDTFAANGYDGTNNTTDSRYYKGYPEMRLQTDVHSSSVYTRQFVEAGLSGNQYKTLGDQEWAVTWDGNETGTANSFLPGIIYGVSRCSKTRPSSTAPGTTGWTTIENSEPLNDLENIESYVHCYCKMTGVGLDGMITPVRDSSQAPWVFFGSTYDSAGACAYDCASVCARDVRSNASFRRSLMGWAVE